MKNVPLYLFFLSAIFLNACTSPDAEPLTAEPEEVDKYLHVPSPEWEDQVIYFIVTDRFMDGDTSNNDQGAGEYRKGDGNFWNGGDFQGITQKMDYIKALGATGIWITPPVANQWRNPQQTGTGNHGYWASNFVEVDPHYGTLEEYKQLSATLHKNEMYLIQDVVCNHMGDFYTYTGPYNPEDVTENFKLHDVPQPTQYPFNHNDARDPKDREMAIYHFAPSFHDHSDTVKKRNYQFAGLDDLNTANPLVRKALRSSYNYWVGEVGVDGFRFDTPHMVEHDFWHDFLHSKDPSAPGVENYAAGLGKDHFLTFGETAVLTLPFDNSGPYEAAAYLGTKDKPEMRSILNFPLFTTIQNVFKEGKPTTLMTYRLENTQKIFDQPEWLLNFIDNHDGARFLSQASRPAFRQALLFIMTIPGIPVIYYGTEQELLDTRQTMFRGGAGSPDQDHFNTGSESFRFLQGLIRMRKENAVFRRGELKVLRDNPGGPGIFAFQMKYEGEQAIVLFNTSETRQLADNIPTGLEEGAALETLFSLTGKKETYEVDSQGNFSALLRPNAGIILVRADGKGRPPSAKGSIAVTPLEDPLVGSSQLTARGTSKEVSDIHLCIDGAYEKAAAAEVQADGSWSAELPLDQLLDGPHRITAFSPAGDRGVAVVSAPVGFELSRSAVLCAEYQDPAGDDLGPDGTYRYPSHPSYTRQMDIEAVKVYRIGSNLKVDITMGEATRIWLPPNGFDHVLINIYIDLPKRTGIKALPLQNAEMPDGADWDYLASAAGFANAIYSSDNASTTNPGRACRPTAFVSADHDNKTISFLIPAASIGFPTSLKGAKLYINTWDGSPGNLSELKPDPGPWTISGGAENDPRIMDDTELISLK